jgi:hypothetical protein
VRAIHFPGVPAVPEDTQTARLKNRYFFKKKPNWKSKIKKEEAPQVLVGLSFSYRANIQLWQF